MDTSTMSSSAASNSESSPSIPATDTLKRKSDDVGWEYGELIDPRSLDRVKCKLCSKVVSGGIFRLKQHVARIKGNVASCTKSTLIDAAKCKSALEMVKKKKVNRRDTLEELRAEVNITGSENASEADVPIDQPHSLGPMDKFARQISATDSSLEARKNRRQQALSDSLFKSRTKEVHTYFARWVYESGIPFNAINNDAFHQFVESVGQFGPGYLPPTQYQLREPLLKEAVQNTKDSMKTQEDEWKKSGCSVMTDAWSDRKRRSIMNLCVNCKLGKSVLTCIEAFFPEDFEKQHLVCNSELLRYKAMEGIFSRKLAILGRTNNDDNFNPVAWWSNYGSETPNLQMMAMKILSLTSSSSGCERNWSAFEGIHTKKRNRLDAERMSLLVYVQFNSRLVNKHKRIKEKCDFLLANDAVMAQGWIVEGGDDDIDDEFQGSTTTRDDTIRELDEENFHSDDEPENDEEFVFGGSDQEYW